ncbi:MAG: hypothetical protein A3I89_02965 [Candidatus Harrisonbacteria bacterium RIFCSPLOWO2_02_FULL_41_11]|uniref:Uncharacterized protein n=1 Tax=Candidatus Harrisonbacteria bacterium RIFCSPHIGHO2_02_FULL_42_16 TaxID=1798404 RepID=A0A1G1ZHG3_9BACT|nr:MAG: hypothetical protein A3B92_04245 [Candidatus Harrisonbacteria bacterium RIFCSPHIGHO2_02_FULL_42_16]OGY66778.1 MAG: hypothetical protein A3I89_02965 [Candidatus Harrisonbacteria bacterium RIFCSPLOWO2_02_FULL_41_11]
MIRAILKKLFLAMALTGLLNGTLYFSSWQKTAYAIAGSTDEASLATLLDIAGNTGAGAAAGATGAGAETSQLTKTITQLAWEAAGQILKKQILDRLVDKTVEWINKTPDGKGPIIEDWGEFFEEAKQGAIGDVAKQLGLGFLCAPFNLQVQLSVLAPRKFSQEAECTLDKITGNIENFMDDFKNGGWIAYNELWNPQNNYYGASLLAANEVTRAQNDAVSAARDEAIAGEGFLSRKICDDNEENCRTVTPGSFVAQAAKTAYITYPFDAIIGADDVAAYITAIADAAIKRLIKEGIAGFKSSGGKSSEYTDGTPITPCSGLTGNDYAACAASQSISKSSFENDRFIAIAQIEDTLNPRLTADLILSRIINNQASLTSALKDLSACQPSDNDIPAELSLETGVLNNLKIKQNNNLSFIEPLKNASDKLNSLDNGDYAGLALNLNSVQRILNPVDADTFLTSVKNDETNINLNVDTKLPSIQDELRDNNCLITL